MDLSHGRAGRDGIRQHDGRVARIDVGPTLAGCHVLGHYQTGMKADVTID